MNTSVFKKTLQFVLPITSLAFMASCASKPKGYSALPAGSDIAIQMDQTESLLVAAKSAHLGLLAPEAFKKAEDSFAEAKEDRADKEDNKDILENIALSQAYLKLAETGAKVSGPALAPVIQARTGAVDAEADRILTKQLTELDSDLTQMAREIEKDANLESARDDGPKLAKKYAELRTESLEKGGRSAEQRNLKQQVKDLRAENAATAQVLVQNNAQKQALSDELGSRSNQDAKLNAIRTKFSPQEADVLVNSENEIVIRLKGIQFPSNKSDIPASSLPLLSKLQQALQEFPNSKITVEGHTDSLGSKEVNDALSKQRAVAVSGYLIQSQKDVAREIETIGKGISEPIAPNKTAEGRAQNRRIDVVIDQSTSQTL